MTSLEQGIAALKAGQREEARKLLAEALRQNPDDQRTWQWMFNAANDDKERISCLRQILRINPKNEKAAQMLAQLNGLPLKSPSSPKPVSSPRPASPPAKKSKLLPKKTIIILVSSIGVFLCACVGIVAALVSTQNPPPPTATVPPYTSEPILSDTPTAQLILPTFTTLPLTATVTCTPTLAETPIIFPTFTPSNTVFPIYTISPSRTPSTSPSSCCMHCSAKSKPCGNSCISRNYTCHKPPGCACY